MFILSVRNQKKWRLVSAIECGLVDLRVCSPSFAEITISTFEELVAFVQCHFTDGLVLVVGSGLSLAEGIPGMGELALHLDGQSGVLTGEEAGIWARVKVMLEKGDGLEAALIANPPTDPLESWITKHTCDLLLPREREVIGDVLHGRKVLRLTEFLAKSVLKPRNGIPIITPNYDRLVEIACEMAGFHVDTTAIGIYAGSFDHNRSCMGSARGLTKTKIARIDHYPRAVVCKPHGSFDWYRCGTDARRCSVDVEGERLIITPGLNKYRAGYGSPFDKHRDLGNDHVKNAARLLIVGYGFNDDHLQVHLKRQIEHGIPTLILNRSLSANVEALVRGSPSCVCMSRPVGAPGLEVTSKNGKFTRDGADLWDLGTLTKELLT